MKRIQWTVFGIVILMGLNSLSITASAAPAVIPFEDLTTTGPGEANQVTVFHQYAGKGISFNSPTALDYSKGATPWKYQGFAHSGSIAIEQCYGKEFCTTPIQMDFTDAQKRVKVWVGYSDNLADQKTVILRAFDAAGIQVGQTTTTFQPSAVPIPIQTPMEVLSDNANIYKATVNFAQQTYRESPTNWLAVDDVEFDTVGPPPPCTSTQNPIVTLSQPASGQIAQSNAFMLEGAVTTTAPLENATLTVTGSGGSNSLNLLSGGLISQNGGTFGPTRIDDLLFSGSNTITVQAQDCKGSGQASTKVDRGQEVGVDRPGKDYKHFNVATGPEECRSACDIDPICEAYTFVKLQGQGGVCWLKFDVPSAQQNDSCISGVKGMEYDMDRGGSDYNMFNPTPPDPALCRLGCLNDAACKAWTYVKPDGHGSPAQCWVKHSAPAGTPKISCISGVKGMEVDIERGGSDYKVFELANAEPASCQFSCSMDAACQAWTYVKPGVQGPNARCRLKQSVPGVAPNTWSILDAIPNECCISGVKGMEYDIERSGVADYKDFALAKADPASCQFSCSIDAACKAWTYVKPGIQGPNARCRLKQSIPTFTGYPNGCCVSGVKGMEYDMDRGGSDYKSWIETDPARCQISCDGDPACEAWTFAPAQGANTKCWLKRSVPVATPTECCVSGVKSMEYDIDRAGSDYKNFDLTAPDPALCKTACSGDPASCQAWTYVKPGILGPNAWCFLKNSAPAATASPCCISGTRPDFTPKIILFTQTVLPPPENDKARLDWRVEYTPSHDPFGGWQPGPSCSAKIIGGTNYDNIETVGNRKVSRGCDPSGLDYQYKLIAQCGTNQSERSIAVPKLCPNVPTPSLTTYYFKATQSSIVTPCFVFTVTATSEEAAKQSAQNNAENATVTKISEADFYDPKICSQ